MRMAMRVMATLAALVLLGTAAPLLAHDSGGCDAFTWDVSRELQAMRAEPRPLPAATHLRAEPAQLQEGSHFTANLMPQDSISLAAPPGKKARAVHPTAGLLLFKSEKGGVYRIALTSRHWIDVVDGAHVIESRAHQGRSGCKLLHKIVEFELPAQRPITIQLSGDDASTVGIVITAVGTT